jgi:hypothetical protein
MHSRRADDAAGIIRTHVLNPNAHGSLKSAQVASTEVGYCSSRSFCGTNSLDAKR